MGNTKKEEAATKKTTEVAQFEEVNEASIQQAIENGNFTEMMGGLSKSYSLTSSYLEMEEGEVLRAVVVSRLEIDAMNEGDGKSEAIRMITETGETLVTASTVIVKNLSGIDLPCPVQIEHHGKEKGKNGFFYDNYKVYKLTPPTQK